MNLSPLQLLSRCRTLKDLKSIHAYLLVDSSICYSDQIANRLIRIYSRFGSVDVARKLFDEITEPNSYLWTAMLYGLVENHCYSETLSFFKKMRNEDVPLLNFTLSTAIKSLSRQERLRDGDATHGLALKCGYGSDPAVSNAIIDLYMRCGQVGLATRLFDEMDERDLVSWNSMISGCGNNNMLSTARKLFNEMPERNVISWTSMICAYIKLGDMVEARSLFDAMPVKDMASWNVMISGYMEKSDVSNALLMFEKMPNRNTGSWNMMISGFLKAGKLDFAKGLFGQMPSRNIASWTMMIDGYIKAGNIDFARSLFDQMSEKNLITWSTMISGYAKNGQPHAALCLFEQFKSHRIKPDETFILGVISACAQLGVLETAESVIGTFLETDHFSNVQLVTGLIDMYAKCGSIEKAQEIFQMVHKKDLLCYSSMISAFANHGQGQNAIFLFDQMLKEKITPDAVIFLAVLSACNHAGFVSEGKKYFNLMKDEFRVQPSERHYACMVDLLGRAGRLQEAYDLIMLMPTSPGAVVWGAMLSACRIHRDVRFAETAAYELLKIEPDNSGNYMLLANIYAEARRWDDVAKVRAVMIKEQHVKKNRGSSWIELDLKVHEFVKADTSHLESKSIYSILHLIMKDMKPFVLAMDECELTEEAESQSLESCPLEFS